MKKIALILVLLLTAAPVLVYAHPPSDIKITFDDTTKTLTAVIYHDVQDVMMHFIKKADIGLNGKEIATKDFTQQDNNQTQTVTYVIPDAKVGDTVFVEGYCNIAGKLKKELQL